MILQAQTAQTTRENNLQEDCLNTPKTVETRELRTDLVYRLRVIVANPDGGLRHGMPVTVTLDLSAEK